MRLEAIAAPCITAFDYPSTNPRSAFERAHQHRTDTYVMRAAPRAWKNMATKAVRELRYPPRRLKSASRPVNKAMCAKKNAMRYQANMNRDR